MLSGLLSFYVPGDKILDAAQSVFGSEITLVVGLYDKAADFIDKGWTGLTEWLGKLWDEIKDNVIDVNAITGELIGAVKTALVKTAAEQVAKWAASLNPAGGIAKAVEAIYKIVKWVVDNWSKLQKLAESVVAGVKALIDGSGVEKVATLVEEGVAKVFATAASFILSFFGLDAVPKAIRGVVSKLANVIPDKIRDLLGKLKDVLLRKLESLWGGLWGRAEWTVGGEKHKASEYYPQFLRPPFLFAKFHPTIKCPERLLTEGSRKWRLHYRQHFGPLRSPPLPLCPMPDSTHDCNNSSFTSTTNPSMPFPRLWTIATKPKPPIASSATNALTPAISWSD